MTRACMEAAKLQKRVQINTLVRPGGRQRQWRAAAVETSGRNRRHCLKTNDKQTPAGSPHEPRATDRSDSWIPPMRLFRRHSASASLSATPSGNSIPSGSGARRDNTSVSATPSFNNTETIMTTISGAGPAAARRAVNCYWGLCVPVPRDRGRQHT